MWPRVKKAIEVGSYCLSEDRIKGFLEMFAECVDDALERKHDANALVSLDEFCELLDSVERRIQFNLFLMPTGYRYLTDKSTREKSDREYRDCTGFLEDQSRKFRGLAFEGNGKLNCADLRKKIKAINLECINSVMPAHAKLVPSYRQAGVRHDL